MILNFCFLSNTALILNEFIKYNIKNYIFVELK